MENYIAKVIKAIVCSKEDFGKVISVFFISAGLICDIFYLLKQSKIMKILGTTFISSGIYIFFRVCKAKRK